MAVRRPVRADSRVDLVLAAVCGVFAIALLVLPPSVRSGAAAAVRSTLAAPVAALQAKAELSRKAFLAHDAALQIADSVALRSLRLTGVDEENGRLRKLLGLGAALKWGFIPAEVLEGRGLGDDFTVTLSAGSKAGVVALAPIVTAEGLVGIVEHADPTLSLAILWPHPDFRVSAMAADGSAFGIVTAHGGDGASRYFLELHSVPLRSPLKAGTLLVSSGLGGVFPKGIPVGVVVSELKTSEGFARSFLVRPMVGLPDLSSVFVLTPQRAQAGVLNVWDSAPSVDSMQKAIVTASDSLRARRDTTARARPPGDSAQRASARRLP